MSLICRLLVSTVQNYEKKEYASGWWAEKVDDSGGVKKSSFC
jgi:hypothetical protein